MFARSLQRCQELWRNPFCFIEERELLAESVASASVTRPDGGSWIEFHSLAASRKMANVIRPSTSYVPLQRSGRVIDNSGQEPVEIL